MKILTITRMEAYCDNKIIVCLKEDDFENYPEAIVFLGQYYQKGHWTETEVYYRSVL